MDIEGSNCLTLCQREEMERNSQRILELEDQLNIKEMERNAVTAEVQELRRSSQGENIFDPILNLFKQTQVVVYTT